MANARGDLGREEQHRAYLQGHRRNPLTTTPLGGRLLSASQLLWFTLLPPTGFGVLTTIGRRTRKPRRRCVRAIRAGDTAYLVSLRGRHASWMKNVEADPRVRLRIRSGTFTGTARALDDPAERARARELYCGTLNLFDRLEYPMHRRGRPTRAAIRALHEHWFAVGTPLAVDLDQDGRGAITGRGYRGTAPRRRPSSSPRDTEEEAGSHRGSRRAPR